jgi:hypothetical protein
MGLRTNVLDPHLVRPSRLSKCAVAGIGGTVDPKGSGNAAAGGVLSKPVLSLPAGPSRANASATINER